MADDLKPFDVLAARSDGHSDAEIADYLASTRKFNAGQARKDGYTDAEIISHLTGATLAPQALNASGTANAADHAAAQEAPSMLRKGAQAAGNVLAGVGDVGSNLASNFVAAPVAGVAGIVQGAKNLISGDPTNMSAADRATQVQNALTYQPRTEGAKQYLNVLTKPLQWAAQGANKAGEITTDVTGSPAAGAFVNTAIQAAPMLIAPEVRGAFGSAGSAVINAGKAGAAKIGIGAAPPAAAAASAAASPAATAAAQGYVANTLGMDWNAIGKATQDQLTTIAKSAGQLDKLDPAAVKRQVALAALPVPVPATAGQLARDPVALRNEGNVSTTTAGAPIRDVHLAANQALLDNLDVLKSKVAGVGDTASQALSPEQVSVQPALRAKLAFQQAKVKQLYQAAQDSGETQAKVDTQPILDMIGKTPDQSHFGYAKNWLENNTEGPGSGTSINDLEDLRKAAVAKAMNGGEDGYYAGKLIGAIDDATDGAGGKLYADARAARKAQALEFGDQGSVAKLVDDKSRTDRATALENTVRSIANGSLEDVQNVKGSLLTGGDVSTRTAGRTAWRDVRAQVIQDIKDRASNGVATNVDGSPNLTPAALKRAIDSYGQSKLDAIFGPATTRHLNAIMEAARTVKTLPPSAAVGSSTMANMLAFLEKGLTKTPLLKIVGGPAVDLVHGVAQLKDIGAGARQAEAATTTTPLSEAIATASSKATWAARRRAAGQTLPLSQLYQQQQPQ